MGQREEFSYVYVFLILTSVELLVIRIFGKTLIHSSPFLQASLLIIQCASSHEIQLALQFFIPYFAKQSCVLFVLQLFNYFFDIYEILYILNIAQFVPFFGFIFNIFVQAPLRLIQEDIRFHIFDMKKKESCAISKRVPNLV